MNLPKDFEHYFSERWRQEDVEALMQGLDSEPSVSIRVNPSRLSLDAEPEGADGRVPWCPEGIYLKERPQFTADPLLHAGAYYVQEASSMFLSHVLRKVLPHVSGVSNLLADASYSSDGVGEQTYCLDLCAAPGGKSTLLRSLLSDNCFLVSNEANRTRAQVLAENMAKWGNPNVVVTQAYAQDLTQVIADSPFSLILADVPCSGEGMMRKEEQAVTQWSPAFVADCAALQRSIVADIWPTLRPGGVLIYSTCTFNPEEDEENVEWIMRELGADLIPIPVEAEWGIRGDMRKHSSQPLPVVHFLPGQIRGEGFFMAVLQKRQIEGDDANSDHFIGAFSADECAMKTRKKDKKGKGKGKGKGASRPATLIDILRESQFALPTNQLEAADAPRVELSLVDAFRYLQREALTLPAETPRGLVQVCYRGQRLGLMNNLGARANNLYPKEWRIRSGHLVPHSIFP